MLGRLRRAYGPRFFDVVTVDAWYATEPFFKAVRKLGWPVVAVLKQERYDISLLHGIQVDVCQFWPGGSRECCLPRLARPGDDDKMTPRMRLDLTIQEPKQL